MKKIESISDLDNAIQLLEVKQYDEKKILEELFYETYESLKPINIIKNFFKETLASQDLKTNLLNTTVGMGIGYFSKILFQNIVKIPFKKFFGNALMFNVENLVAKNPEIVNSLLNMLLNTLSSKSSKSAKNVHKDMEYEPLDLDIIY